MIAPASLSLLRGSRALVVNARWLGLREVLGRRRLRAIYAGRSRASRQKIAAAIWREAAENLGVEMHAEPGGRFEFQAAGRRARVVDLMTPVAFADPVRSWLANDKRRIYSLPEPEGVPVAPHLLIDASDVAAAPDFLACGRRPVVKPIRGAEERA